MSLPRSTDQIAYLPVLESLNRQYIVLEIKESRARMLPNHEISTKEATLKKLTCFIDSYATGSTMAFNFLGTALLAGGVTMSPWVVGGLAVIGGVFSIPSFLKEYKADMQDREKKIDEIEQKNQYLEQLQLAYKNKQMTYIARLILTYDTYITIQEKKADVAPENEVKLVFSSRHPDATLRTFADQIFRIPFDEHLFELKEEKTYDPILTKIISFYDAIKTKQAGSPDPKISSQKEINPEIMRQFLEENEAEWLDLFARPEAALRVAESILGKKLHSGMKFVANLFSGSSNLVSIAGSLTAFSYSTGATLPTILIYGTSFTGAILVQKSAKYANTAVKLRDKTLAELNAEILKFQELYKKIDKVTEDLTRLQKQFTQRMTSKLTLTTGLILEGLGSEKALLEKQVAEANERMALIQASQPKKSSSLSESPKMDTDSSEKSLDSGSSASSRRSMNGSP